MNGNPLANTGLWGLTFGNGGNGGDVDKLYFAAGINEQRNGLFGSISAVPVVRPLRVDNGRSPMSQFGHNQPLAVVPEISTERPFAPHRPGVV